MSIELHCPKCSKLIRAPDNAGGKHGKCPYCQGKVYIPMPPDENEEIGLAPIDAEEERQMVQARRESSNFAGAVGHATAGPDEPPGKPARAAGKPAKGSVDVGQEVEQFVIAMRDSKLEAAEAAAERLKSAGREARIQVKKLAGGDGVPAIEGVPPPVVQGFLKNLLQRLG